MAELVADRLRKSLDKYPNWQDVIEWGKIDSYPVSISHPIFDQDNPVPDKRYLCIAANFQALGMNPKNMIISFFDKASEIATKHGYNNYMSSGQDYLVFVKDDYDN